MDNQQRSFDHKRCSKYHCRKAIKIGQGPKFLSVKKWAFQQNHSNHESYIKLINVTLLSKIFYLKGTSLVKLATYRITWYTTTEDINLKTYLTNNCSWLLTRHETTVAPGVPSCVEQRKRGVCAGWNEIAQLIRPPHVADHRKRR